MAEEAPIGDNPVPTSTSDLMGSAKIVAEAAQLACSQQTDKIDKAKVAGASEDILEAAKSYGKLDESSGIGQYVNKAEGFLHQYNTKSQGPVTDAENKAEPGPDGADMKAESAPDVADKEPSSGGSAVGGLMNMAKGLF